MYEPSNLAPHGDFLLLTRVVGLGYHFRHGTKKTGDPIDRDSILTSCTQVLSIVGLGLVAGQVMNGAGQHVGDIAPATNTYGLKLNFISQPIYLWAIPLVKISVGIFLLRITPSKVYRTILVSVMTFLMLYTMMCFITILIQCKNISFLWDFSVKTTCWTTETLLGLSYANSC